MLEARIDDRGLGKRLSGAPSHLASETRQAMQASLLLIEGAARQGVAQDTRRLAGSITHTIAGSGANLTGRVGPSVRYGYWVEHGRKAGKPPPLDAIAGWARRHGIHPFVVARAIGRRGTRPRPFLVPAFEKHRARIERLFRDVGVKVVSRLAG